MAKHSKLTYTLLAIALCSLTTACEKPLLEDEEEYKETEAPKGDMVRITFRNFKTNQKSFSQRKTIHPNAKPCKAEPQRLRP